MPPILEDVPRVSYGVSADYRGVDVLSFKIEGELIEYFCGMPMMLEKDVGVSTVNESRMLHRFEDFDALSTRLEFYDVVAKVNGSASMLDLVVAEGVDYRKFCEVFSCMKQSIDIVRLIKREEVERFGRPVKKPVGPISREGL